MHRFKKSRPSSVEGIIEKKFGRIMRNMSFPGKNVAYFSTWEPAVDIYQTGNNLVLYVDISGVPEEKIQFSLEEKRLVISGERVCAVKEITKVHQLENEYGPFERLIDLPIAVDSSSLSIENTNGFLVIRLAG